MKNISQMYLELNFWSRSVIIDIAPYVTVSLRTLLNILISFSNLKKSE